MEDMSKEEQGAAHDPERDIKLGECEKKRDEYLAGWQRAKADFINYKREELARLQDMAKYAVAELVEELICVLDSFDLGIAALEKQGPVEKGVYMIRVQLEDVLKKRGLERIAVKRGDRFDPSIAEVVGETDSELPEGTVVEEIEPGYRLYDKIIRPARVKVSKGKPIANS
ncbi:MAG: nucleotide exchange factor GrpE [Candidatus Liptonbacteria bacterium]|nr:nucleotide exchange factor GrpE [Candidatus Liptonbacteria bacterium]